MREPEHRDPICTCGHPWGDHLGDAPHLCTKRTAGHGCHCAGFSSEDHLGLDDWDDDRGMTELQKRMFDA